MNKLKQALLNIWYGLPFGLKAADDEIAGAKVIDINGANIAQEVSDERVGKHLLKGEVTQEVEELRYRTYKVANESQDYNYLGNGIAVKEAKPTKERNKTKYSFSQNNDFLTESVLETLKQVGGVGIEKHRFSIDYNIYPRFKLENFATLVDVRINDKEGLIETTLHFNKEPNPYDATSMPFINELKKLSKIENEYALSRNDIASSLTNLTFTTYKANGEEDLVNYCFINGAKYEGMEENDHEFLVRYSWNEYMRLPLDLETKYYSKEMAEKYKNKTKKNVDISIKDGERKAYCSICGKEMSIYDADIMSADGMEPICEECMQKVLNNSAN